MTTALTIAQLGAGYWGPNLIRNFMECESLGRFIVCDVNHERLTKLRKTFGERISTTIDSNAIFRDPSVDAVVIALPAALHYAFARRALQAGKHVLVEKPLAMKKTEAATLVRLAAEQKKILMVGHTFLYNAAVRKVKDYIASGTLGDIYYIFSQRLNLGKVRDDVNVVWNLAPHDISIILYWLGEMPSAIQAKGISFLQPGIEDVAFLHLDFPSKTSAHIHVSWLDPSKTRSMVIVGSKKMLVYDDVSQDSKITIYDKGIDKKNIMRDLPEINSFGQFQLMQRVGDMTVPKLNFVEPLSIECQHFIDCIERHEQPITNGEHGCAVVTVLEQIDRVLHRQKRGK